MLVLAAEVFCQVSIVEAEIFSHAGLPVEMQIVIRPLLVGCAGVPGPDLDELLELGLELVNHLQAEEFVLEIQVQLVLVFWLEQGLLEEGLELVLDVGRHLLLGDVLGGLGDIEGPEAVVIRTVFADEDTVSVVLGEPVLAEVVSDRVDVEADEVLDAPSRPVLF